MAVDTRSKPDPVDIVAEEAVRMLNVAPLLDEKATASAIFTRIALCEDFVEREKPSDPDATFTEMALELSRTLIDHAASLNSLEQAYRWVAANGGIDGTDAMSVLSVLTLIHIVNRAVKRYPKDEKWRRMKKRVEKLKPVRKAA